MNCRGFGGFSFSPTVKSGRKCSLSSYYFIISLKPDSVLSARGEFIRDLATPFPIVAPFIFKFLGYLIEESVISVEFSSAFSDLVRENFSSLNLNTFLFFLLLMDGLLEGDWRICFHLSYILFSGT